MIGSQPRSNLTVCSYCVSGGGGGGEAGKGVVGERDYRVLTTLHSLSGYTVEIFLSS